MSRAACQFVLTVALGLLMLVCPYAPAQEAEKEVLPSRLVTPAILEAKIQEIEAATGLEDESKGKLIELYRKAQSNLQTAALSSNKRQLIVFHR